jgi:hypothetical protein
VLPRIEFRIPIAPTMAFYNRVHFFCAALRRLGPSHADSLVRIVVGDYADLDEVRRINAWATQYNLQWHRVPDEVSAVHDYYGTSDFRYALPESTADLVVLADADTALVQPVAQDFSWMLCDEPCIAGHMAHIPPPSKFLERSDLAERDFWPFLFREFSIPFPDELYRYSRDLAEEFPTAPAYYNLGFVALNWSALRIVKAAIFDVHERLNKMIRTEMRCQIALTLISYKHAFKRRNLPAIFNAANDEPYLRHNRVRPNDIKVLHYLRTNELDRDTFLTANGLAIFLKGNFHNPVNQLLQQIGREIITENLEFAQLTAA